jgi:hypothetical protein
MITDLIKYLHFLVQNPLSLRLKIAHNKMNLSDVFNEKFQLIFQIFQSSTHFYF